jgi:hypothetical protein
MDDVVIGWEKRGDCSLMVMVNGGGMGIFIGVLCFFLLLVIQWDC